MSSQIGPIFFLSGAPGVGKSSTARALANRFPKAVLFDIDYFRKLVVCGLSEPSEDWSEETTLQFHLAHVAVGQAAKTYSQAGFAVIAEQCSSVESIQTFLENAGGGTVISLKADLPINLKRNRERTNKSFDPLDIEHFVLTLGESMPRDHEQAGFHVIDNTNLTIDETVERILSLT